MQIFVSYTRRDGLVTEVLLSKLHQQLQAEGHQVFIHALMPSHAEHEQWAVMRALFRSDCVLLIQSPKLNRSPWAWIERITARLFGIPIHNVSHLALHRANVLPATFIAPFNSLRG